jgi:hypothetical protein
MNHRSSKARSIRLRDDAADAPHPDLHRIEADIASVYLARLEGLFKPEALGLQSGPHDAGGFLARISRSDFWTCAMCKKNQLRDSPAAHFYIQTLFAEQASLGFQGYCQVWGQSFFAARHDVDSARDILLLFLDQNLRYLKRLYILEQPGNQDLPPTAQALEHCFDSPANAMLFVGGHFSRWVLEDWLPFHLRSVCCREFLAHEEMLARECPRDAMDGAVSALCCCQ